jgi:hypothetical protein
MNVELHIENVVLIGMSLPPGGEAQLRRVLEAELAARIASPASPSLYTADVHIPHVAVPDIGFDAATTPFVLGQQLSAAVATGLHR